MDEGFKLFIFLVCCILSAHLGAYLSNYAWTQQGINRGYMEYCTKTGDLEWIGECQDVGG